jgi:hypothetical protein
MISTFNRAGRAFSEGRITVTEASVLAISKITERRSTYPLDTNNNGRNTGLISD